MNAPARKVSTIFYLSATTANQAAACFREEVKSVAGARDYPNARLVRTVKDGSSFGVVVEYDGPEDAL